MILTRVARRFIFLKLRVEYQYIHRRLNSWLLREYRFPSDRDLPCDW